MSVEDELPIPPDDLTPEDEQRPAAGGGVNWADAAYVAGEGVSAASDTAGAAAESLGEVVGAAGEVASGAAAAAAEGCSGCAGCSLAVLTVFVLAGSALAASFLR
jgi:hypothetical protein